MSAPRTFATPTGVCRCGCGEPVGRDYAPGHDGRHRNAAARITDAMTPAVRRQFFTDGYKRWVQE